MSKVMCVAKESLVLLWILAACTNISLTAIATETPIHSLDTATALPSTVVPAVTRVSTLAIESDVPPTLSQEQVQEVIGSFLAENANCDSPCFWGFKPGVTEKEEISEFFSLLNKKAKSSKKSGSVQYNLSIGYKSYINISTTFILNQEQNLLLGIQSSIHGLYYPEIANDWTAFRPDTILKTYGDPSSIEFDLSYPAEPAIDPTIGYDVIFRYEASHFVVQYKGQRTINRSQLTICPLKDENFESIYLYIGNTPGFNVPAGKALEEVSSLSVPGFMQLVKDEGNNACINLDRAKLNNE